MIKEAYIEHIKKMLEQMEEKDLRQIYTIVHLKYESQQAVE